MTFIRFLLTVSTLSTLSMPICFGLAKADTGVTEVTKTIRYVIKHYKDPKIEFDIDDIAENDSVRFLEEKEIANDSSAGAEFELSIKQVDPRTLNFEDANEVFDADITIPPFKAAGLVVRKDKKGVMRGCSGQLVGRNNLVVLTAAHCLYDEETGSPFETIYYIHNYKGSTHPRIHAKCSVVARFYRENDSPSFPLNKIAYDYGFIRLETEAPGDYAIRLRPSTSTNAMAIGYPSNYGEGKSLKFTSGNVEKSAKHHSIYGMRGNPFQGGSSGGAWIRHNSYVIGLNSAFRTDNRNRIVMLGPRFDQSFLYLYRVAAYTENCKE